MKRCNSKPEDIAESDAVVFGGAWEGFSIYIPKDMAYEQNRTVVPIENVVSTKYSHDDGFMSSG
jgi:hypothetical protein